MNIIKLLNNMEVGTPLILTTKWQDEAHRRPTIYAGTDGEGLYYFIDNTGKYKCTIGYIRNHIQIKTKLETNEDIIEIAELNKRMKGGVA